MIRGITGILAGLLLGEAALAQSSAIYRDDVITIPGGAVITDEGVSFYRDIRLVNQGDGNFRLAGAERGEIAEVDEVEVNLLDGEQVELTVSGTKSSACVELMEPTVSRKDDVFTVVLAETRRTAEFCILILEFYEESFTFDVGGLEPGVYTVVVNGVEEEFTLD